MLESLLFMLLILVGGIFLMVSIFLLLAGLVKKSKKLKNSGLSLGVVPLVFVGIIWFWYSVAIPNIQESEKEDFVGTYVLDNTSKSLLVENNINKPNPKLILRLDGTFLFDSISGIKLNKKGVWKTGGIDGTFEFYDLNGRILEHASPSGSGAQSALSFRLETDKDIWGGTETILFIKEKTKIK